MARTVDPRHTVAVENMPAAADIIADDELALAASCARVPIEGAHPWAVYYRALAAWRHRCDSYIMDLIASPESYIRKLCALKAKRERRPTLAGWEQELRESVAGVRDQLLALGQPGQNTVGLATEICGGAGSPRAVSLILELSLGGWLPARPLSPAVQTRHRDPKTEAERMAAADRLAADMVGEDMLEPEPGPPGPIIHDWSARAAGDER